MYLLKIAHQTVYEYSAPVRLLPHKLYIRPRSGYDIHIVSSLLDIEPSARVRWQRDIYNNNMALIEFHDPTCRLSIRSEVVLEHYEVAPLDFLVAPHAVQFPFQFDPSERIDLVPYQIPVFPSDTGLMQEWVAQFWRPGDRLETYALLDRINKTIVSDFRYQMREEPGVQSPAETLRHQSGSCRDFSTLFMEACRYLGLPARFVSGYLHCPETVLGHGSTHAWSEVYLPGAGWKGFDSTSGQVVGSSHIAAAVCRRPEDVPPVSGRFLGPTGIGRKLHVQVSVTRE